MKDSNKYIKHILSHPHFASSIFANSLLTQMMSGRGLSKVQLEYVIGDYNPKGFLTFEQTLSEKFPNYLKLWKESNEEGDVDEGENNYETGKKVEERNEDISHRRDAEEENVDLSLRLPTAEYHNYQYPFEYFNPIQSHLIQHIEKDVNLVISSATSSGKTIMAELVMDHVLKGSKCLYMSPLKALSNEKKEDWEKRFGNCTITLLTGDTLFSEKERVKQMTAAKKSDIILCTCELVDSLTRQSHRKENDWISEVGLLIVDEAHSVAMEGRGHTVEAALMRFTAINKNCRILFLSATMPNVSELAKWLTVLNNKMTETVHSTWRPIPLNLNLIEYKPSIYYSKNEAKTNYKATEKLKLAMTISIIESKPEEKWLCFVHSKQIGRNIVNELKKKGIEARFHNADLEAEDRKEVEDSFRNKQEGLRVLVSTSTTAMGLNLPARNVVVHGIHRGIQEVDEMDIIQMVGRCGRLGIDDKGFAYVLIPDGTKEHWLDVFKCPKPIKSTLNRHEILAFHILGEIASKHVKDTREALRWYDRSLAQLQNIAWGVEEAEALIDDLEKMQMLTIDKGELRTTGLGLTSAWLYKSPYDIFEYYQNWKQVLLSKKIDDLSIAYACGNIPSIDLGYVPKEIQSQIDEIGWRLKARGMYVVSTRLHYVYAYLKCLEEDKVEEEGLVRTLMRTIRFDVGRTIQTFKLIDSMYAKWGREDVWNTLGDRIIYGIPEQLVSLVAIPGVGAKRARRLFNNSITCLEDVANPDNLDKLYKVFSPSFAKRIQKSAERQLH